MTYVFIIQAFYIKKYFYFPNFIFEHKKFHVGAIVVRPYRCHVYGLGECKQIVMLRLELVLHVISFDGL